MTATERRLATRFNFKLPLRVRISKSATPERAAESLNVSARGMYLRQIYRYKRAHPCNSFLRCRRKSATNLQRNGTAQVMLFMFSRAVHPRAQSV